MKDEGMPLGDFRFCFPYEPCSQELKGWMAALNVVTGAQIRTNLARAAREAEMARLEAIDQRVKAQMRAEAHDRIGQSMALAAQIRKAGYAAKCSELPVLCPMWADKRGDEIRRIDRRRVVCVAARGVRVRLHLSGFDSIVTPSDLLRTIHYDRQFAQ